MYQYEKGHSPMCVQCRRRGLFFIQLTLWVVPYVVAAVGIDCLMCAPAWQVVLPRNARMAHLVILVV